MRGLLWVIGAFAAAVAISLALEGDGYVAINLPPWRVELSLVFAVVVLLGIFVIGYFFVRVAAHALGLPAQVRAFRERRNEARAREALRGAMQAQVEGRYARAEKFAQTAWEGGAEPAIAAMIGARAAQRRRDYRSEEPRLNSSHT